MKLLIKYLKYCMVHCLSPFLPLPTRSSIRKNVIKQFKTMYNIDKLTPEDEFHFDKLVASKLELMDSMRQLFKDMSLEQKKTYFKALDSYDKFKYFENIRNENVQNYLRLHKVVQNRHNSLPQRFLYQNT